jgi:hypothetical protein
MGRVRGRTQDPLAGLRSRSAADGAQYRNSAAVEQAGGTAGDTVTLMRDPGSPHGPLSAAIEATENSAGTGGQADSRESFATLDAGTATGRGVWVHAGAQRAEAGFQDPALGWVGVRAETGGGGVHAAVVPGSDEAARVLGSQLGGLNAYLADQHRQVDSLTLAAPEGHSSGLALDRGTSQDLQQGPGQDRGQGGAEGRQSGAQSDPISFAAAPAPHRAVQGASVDSLEQTAVAGGTHISVIA